MTLKKVCRVDGECGDDNVLGQNAAMHPNNHVGEVCPSKDDTYGIYKQALPAINIQTPNGFTASSSAAKGPSNEIQQIQHQPPFSSSQSKGRKKDDLIEKENWSPEESSTPLRNLLVEANLVSKQKTTNEQHRNVLLPSKSLQDGSVTTEVPTSKLACEDSRWSSFNRKDQGEWDSPARLPARKNEKNRAKVKPNWRPFMCWKYVC